MSIEWNFSSDENHNVSVVISLVRKRISAILMNKHFLFSNLIFEIQRQIFEILN